MNQTPVTRREVSEWLGIKQATLRTWDRKFRDWLEADVGKKGNATRKQYTVNDLKVFQAISQLRQRGATFDEIYDKLDGELLNTQLPDFGAMAMVQSTTSQPIMTSQQYAPSMPSEDLLRMHQEIAELRGQLSAVTRERDRFMRMLEDEQKDRIAAEKTAAVLEGQLRIYRDGTYPNPPQQQYQQQQATTPASTPPPPPVYRADAPPPLPPVHEPDPGSGTPTSNPDLNRVRRIPNSDEKKEEPEKEFPSWWKKTDRR